MKPFLFLPCYMHHHILSASKRQDPQWLSSLLCPNTNGAGAVKKESAWLFLGPVSAQQNNHMMPLPTRRRKRAQPSSKPPQGQRAKLKMSPLSNQLCKDKIILLIFPFQVQTLTCTTLTWQQELLCASKCFHLSQNLVSNLKTLAKT